MLVRHPWKGGDLWLVLDDGSRTTLPTRSIGAGHGGVETRNLVGRSPDWYRLEILSKEA